QDNRQDNELVAQWVECWTSAQQGREFEARAPQRLGLEQGLLPESQCGYRQHLGTTDMIFAARQLQEKWQEMRTHLYTTFVDLTKAFETGNHDGLWKVMQKFGCPERFTHMVRQLHDGMTVRVSAQRDGIRSIRSDQRSEAGLRTGPQDGIRSIRSDQRSEAGLRTGPHCLRSHVLGYAAERLP
ncbi:unnamed protein product, partial [Schistocephalus solidus]|uniref:Reverse transcriptase domain-containing protein n=1 Tax=Schistocephalus solidus TaxID=70667 RepID=A0A183SUK9_SCHSO